MIQSPTTVTPLTWRAPNPPEPCVGRDDDVARLAALLAKSPVAVVWGFSGVGKSALVQATLHGPLSSSWSKTVWVHGGDGEPTATLRSRLNQLGAGPTDSIDDLATTIEALGLYVVVDGVERLADLPLLQALTTVLLRHGRQARLVCVCREDPRDVGLATRTLGVGPLADASLQVLLAAVAPAMPKGAADAVIAAAAGSPWRLLQHALGGVVDGDAAGADASLLALSPVARGLLGTLALVPAGLPRSVVQRATRLPDDDAMQALVRRGWLEPLGAGGDGGVDSAWRLHHAARALVGAGLGAEERRRRRHKLVDALLEEDQAPTDVMTERARLALGLATGGPASVDAVAVVVRRGQRLLAAAGQGRTLWEAALDSGVVASSATDQPLWDSLADLALDVGDDAVGRLPPPPRAHGSPWASVCAVRGDLEAARAAFQAAVADDADITDLTDVALRCLELGFDEVAREAIARRGGRRDDRTDLVTAVVAPGDGRRHGGLLARLQALLGEHRASVTPLVARTLLSAGLVDDALVATTGPWALDTAAGRACSIARGRALSAAGRSAEALSVWSTLMPSSSSSSSASCASSSAEARLWCCVDAVRRGVGDDDAIAAEVAAVAGVLREGGTVPRVWAGLLILRAAVAGGRGAGARRTSADADVDASLATLKHRLDEAPGDALEGALRARGAAAASGDHLGALERGVFALDAAIMDGADDDGRALALALENDAALHDVHRVVDEARLARLLLGGRRDASALLALAQGRSPVVRRRARSLLGDDVVLDTVDSQVLQAVTVGGGAGAAASGAVVVGSRGAVEWAVDEARRAIVVGDGVVVDLSDKAVLFSLLTALGRHGGTASKERLLEVVWGVRDYHPLHHDNRLKVAVRKLRRLLEEVLGDDPIEAADDGYRLRGRIRFIA